MKEKGAKGAAIVCARISNEDPDTERVEDQIEECRRWCEREGYEVVGHPVVENGVSGKLPPAERPQVNAALERLRAGQVSVVVWRDDDRLGRNWWTAPLLFEMDDSGEGIQFAHSTRAGDPESRILDRGIRMTIATAERVKVTRRTARGRTRVLAGGKFSGGSYPWWLTWVQTGKKKSDGDWQINETARPTVDAIVQGYLSGKSADQIAGTLTGPLPCEQNPNWQGRTGVGWRASVVMGIIRNPALAGRLYHRAPDVMVDKAKRADARRRLLWQIIDCPTVAGADALAGANGLTSVVVPEVIPWATFAALQDRRRAAYHAPKKKALGWLLQGRVRCGGCGRLFGAEDSGRGRRRYFRCSGRLKRVALDGPRCDAPRLPYDALLAQVSERLEQMVGDPKALRSAVEDFLGGLDADVAAAAAAVGPVESKLAALDERRRRKARAYGDGAYATDEEYEADLDRIDRERSALAAHAADNESDLIRLHAIQDLAGDIRSSLKTLGDDAGDQASLTRLALGRDLAQWIERLDLRLKVYADRIEAQGAVAIPDLPVPSAQGGRRISARRST